MGHAKSSDPSVFILPDLGEGVHEAELLKWRVQEGQTVEEHQILADMETDKAVVEVPSPRAGTIKILHGSEGETLHVGKPLVTYTDAGGASPAGGAGGHAGDAAVETQAVNQSLQSESPQARKSEYKGSTTGAAAAKAATNGSHPPAKEAHREDAGTVVGAVGGALGGISAAPGKALATPAVRRLARDLGVDIDSVQGTGLAGRVTEKDVRAAQSTSGGGSALRAESPPSPSKQGRSVASPRPPDDDFYAALKSPAKPAAPQPGAGGLARASASSAPGDTQRIPFRGVRRTIANRLRESVGTAVHFTVMDEADVSALDTLRKRLASASGEKVSFLPFVASAVARCLSGEFTDFNATTDDAAEEIVRHRAVHLGIATDTDAGLMVPVVRDADKLGVLEIGRHITHVAEAARNRSAAREMLMGSTFTISNVGSHAGRFATPIINYPECGILAVGRARDGVVVRQGAIAVGKVLPLSLACDHRVVDGARAALMLAQIVEMLQSPEQLLGPARG